MNRLIESEQKRKKFMLTVGNSKVMTLEKLEEFRTARDG